MNKTLEQLETSTIKKLLKALEVSFPNELSLEDFYSEGQTTVFTPWTIPEIGLSNKSSQSKTQLEQYVETITDTKSVRQAYATLFEIYEKRVATKTTEAPKGEEKTTLRSDESEELIRKAEAQQTKVKETRAKAEQDVQNAIKTKIEQAKANAKAVEGKKVFIKVEVEQKGVPILTVEETKIISNYAEEVKKDPKEVQAELENIITDRVTQTLKKQGLSDEEIKLAIKQTAVTLVSNLSNIYDPDRIPENEQIAIYGAISGSPSVIPEAREAAGNVATHSYYSSLSHQHITQTAFGPQFANNIFGLSPELYKVIVSQKPISQDSEKDQPQQEVFEVDLQQLNDNSIKILEAQDGIIERVKDLAQDEARTVILNQTGTFINNQISKIPATSTAGKIVKSPEFRSIFYSKFRVGTPVSWEARNEFAQTVLKYSPESAPYISAVGKIFGIQTGIYTATNVIPLSFGQGIVVSKIAFIQPIKVLPAPFTMAIKTGTKVAVGAGAGAAGAGATGAVAGKAAGGIISKITAFFGSAGGPVGTVVGFVAGTLIGKVIEKIDWAKAKKFFSEWGMPVVVGGALFLAGRPFMGLVAGTGIHLAAKGVTLAAVGYGVWRFFGIIGASIGVAIATPVIVTLLILPPLVAFIMLVINNSAYVVPPSFESGRPGTIPAECLGDPPPKPTATNIRFSQDGRYAFPVAPFETPGYACYHWDGNKAADIFSPQNKPPLLAYESGTIISVVQDDDIGGKYIIMRGSTSGRYYYYAHLCHTYATNGETVSAGDVIGTMDETGTGRVQHLHWAINESPLTDTFIGGDGNVCPQKDFEEKFGFGVCNVNNFCVSP